MRFDILKEFVLISESKGMRTAAEEAGVSLSCLSKHMRQLELEIGTPLIDRCANTLSLNDAGRLFLVYAKKMLSSYNSMSMEFLLQKQLNIQRINLGISPLIFSHVTLAIITEFQSRHSDVIFNIVEGTANKLKNAIIDSECDLALTDLYANLSSDPLFSNQLCDMDQLAVAVPSGHPFEGKSSVSIAELMNERIMILKSDNTLREHFFHLCFQEGFAPLVVYEGTSSARLLNLANSGYGIAILPLGFHRDNLEKPLFFIPLEPLIPIRFEILFLEGVHLPIIHEFAAFFSERLKSSKTPATA